VLLYGVNTDVTVSADVRVKNPGQKPDLRGVEGIGERYFQVEVKNAAFIRTADWTRYRSLPVIVRRV
jgi:hypothetical protein